MARTVHGPRSARSDHPYRPAGWTCLLPVMVAATRYALRTGIVPGLVSSLAYNFFFIPL